MLRITQLVCLAWPPLLALHLSVLRLVLLSEAVQGLLPPHASYLIMSPTKAVLLSLHHLSILAQVGNPEAEPLTLLLSLTCLRCSRFRSESSLSLGFLHVTQLYNLGLGAQIRSDL